MRHELKCQQPYYDDVRNCDKTFEVRVNDRVYAVGDTLELQEWDINTGYTGYHVLVAVTYLTDLTPVIQMESRDNYVGMGIEKMGEGYADPKGREHRQALKELRRAAVDLISNTRTPPVYYSTAIDRLNAALKKEMTYVGPDDL